MKNKLITFHINLIIFLYLLTLSKSSTELPTKRMLVVVTPGVTTKEYEIENLFNYTISHEDIFHYEYHIIIHKIDYEAWINKIKSNNISYKLYSYGSIENFQELSDKLESEINTNSFYISILNKLTYFSLKEFLESDVMKKLIDVSKTYEKKHHQDYFNMIATDIPNNIHKLLYQELNIKLCLYLQLPLLTQTLYSNFEINPSYYPSLSSNKLFSPTKFTQRFKNSFHQTMSQILNSILQMNQNQLLNSYDYEIENGVIVKNALHILQYPLGICSPISLPNNFVLINSVNAKIGKKINNNDFQKFLEKYNKIILLKVNDDKSELSFDDFIYIFNYYNKKNVGVILFSEENENNRFDHYYFDNVFRLLQENITRNDLLSINKINLLVTNKDIYNSIQESVYHVKNMILFDVSIPDYNIASHVKKLNISEIFYKNEKLSREIFIEVIDKKINEIKNEKIQKLSDLIKDLKNPGEEFKYWIDFGYKHGYEKLQISAYNDKFSWIIVNEFDIILIWFGIFVGVLIIINKIISCMRECLCGKCENKHKVKGKKHMKFD